MVSSGLELKCQALDFDCILTQCGTSESCRAPVTLQPVGIIVDRTVLEGCHHLDYSVSVAPGVMQCNSPAAK